jgi:transketolase
VFGKHSYVNCGEDVCILSYGVVMQKEMVLAVSLEERLKSLSIASYHTMKPLDRMEIAEAPHRRGHVVVIEEHGPQGGRAPQAKQIAWDTKASCRLDTFTLQDAFIHNYGSRDDLLAAHGIDVGRILAAVG